MNDFIKELNAFDLYYKKTLAPINPNELSDVEQEEFDPRKYNLHVMKLLLSGLYFKVSKFQLLNERQFNNYIGLVTNKNNMSEERMAEISEFLPLLFRITKVMEGINKRDAACLVYLLDPSK